jgi:signal transduction histidine kinase
MRTGLVDRGARREHLVFGVALVLLAMLTTWWAVLMVRLVDAEHQGARAELLVEVTRAALTGAVDDGRLERVDEAGPYDVAAADAGGRVVRVRPAVVSAMEDHARRRMAMVLGEGTLMLLLVATCVGMLYRLVLAHRAFRLEMFAFVGQVTHEMKTPLAGLKALLETLRLGRLSGEVLDEAIALGLAQVEREERLVHNLLLAQRARSGHELVLRPVELADFLRRYRAGRPDALDGRLALDVAGPCVVRADEDALRSILDNLVDNARKYGARSVEVGARGEPGVARLWCRDDGDGFEPGLAEKLFVPGRRAHGADHAARGTGLGLWIGRTLAEAMGGHLTAASDGPGRGATFTLTLVAVSVGEPTTIPAGAGK